MSEASASQEVFKPYLAGIGLDMGYGGFLVAPNALGFDLPQPYTRVGGDLQTFRGHCGDLSGFCDECMDFIHSSHLLEDFSYGSLRTMIGEWKRVLKVGGYLLTNCPHQQRYLQYNRDHKTEHLVNQAHLEHDFSLAKFNEQVIAATGPWEVVMEQDNFGPYSWLQILRKL